MEISSKGADVAVAVRLPARGPRVLREGITRARAGRKRRGRPGHGPPVIEPTAADDGHAPAASLRTP